MKILYFIPLLILTYSARSVSNHGLSIIKEFEGFLPKAYRCPAGVWTIGYGTTSYCKDIIGTDIRPGMTITEKKASEWLKKVVDHSCSKNVNKYDHIYHWTQNEFDAMVSFAYNIGSIDGLVDNGKRKKSDIPVKMMDYVHANGQVLAGLVRRRKIERDLFLNKKKVVEKKENFCKGKSLREIANEVVRGEWGSGNERVNKLKKAGCDPKKVQDEVNRIFKGN